MLERFRLAKAAEVAALTALAAKGHMPRPFTGRRPSFTGSLRAKAPAVIAEYKRASPSKGDINLAINPEQAAAAVKEGADYIGVGPIFATQTKEDVCAPVGLGYLDHVVRTCPLPCVAIGGIKEHNLAEVMGHGARTVCLVTEIVGAADIPATVRRLQAACRASL